MVRNECVKFGGHVDRQANYNILWLEVPNNAQTLHNPPCFYFEALLIGNTHRTLGVKTKCGLA